ncbi:outer membrane protein TolC [Roseimicrobium gellanilyticum]|uniref:Outer membrane protein TolC n=1 Tax=Roseimicrobium gellanilyticum TaxID=748857 RepID=A0A366HQN5_9BACT|nr:TolC family protein [Roseimicrobium gellanilyticum]RBP45414.1 outer membrane protein TolC [Roseimicrobium gellanilyticum]
MTKKTASLHAFLGLSLAALPLASCSPSYMRKSADREVKGALFSKLVTVPNAGTGLLDITPPAPLSLAELSKAGSGPDFLGDRAQLEKNARVLPLSEALKMAVTHNRDYRNEKELLFLEALDLTLVRHEFAPIFTATGEAGTLRQIDPVISTLREPNPAYPAAAAAAAAATAANNAAAAATGKPAPAAVTTAVPQFLERQITTLVTENTFTATGNVGVSVLTRTGARIAADFTTDFLRFLTGSGPSVSNSSLAVTLTQPLLRGAGYRATMENLTQAERNLLYSIRDFTQYRKTFTVDITSRYYRTLEARDAARNGYLAYRAFEAILESERALGEEGRRTNSQLGLIEQAALRYKRLWIAAVRVYEQQLDDLKIALGIPVEEKVILDDKELSKLSLEDPEMTMDDTIKTALVTRLDLYNQRNTLEDSERKIKVASQNLLPQLDIGARYEVLGTKDNDKLDLNFDRTRLTGTGVVDLRLDKKADRNNYRAALISQQRSARVLDLAEENVRNAIRTNWRDLDTARKQYDIAQTGVDLSARRLEEEELLRSLGRGTARDLIDAQQDLIEARNALTAALISHTLARLRLWRDMGILYIQKDGSWIRVLNQEAKLAADE